MMRSVNLYSLFLLFLQAVLTICTSTQSKTLQFVEVLFRHGDRTNIALSSYPKDPYINETYAPYGLGELTNRGKLRAYRLGKALRERYDDFLGIGYNPQILEALSSDVNRTKASLQLVLAGLFPPTKEELWDEDIPWQPIPTSHKSLDNDQIFLGIYCPNFLKYYTEILTSPKYLEEIKEHEELLKYVSEHTGLNVVSYKQLFLIYVGLETQKEFGLELPEWTRKVYPDKLKEVVPNMYLKFTSTTPLRRLAVGYMLKKIVDDFQMKINGNLEQRKIHLLSGHEVNLANMLAALELFKNDVPPYSAYILFELHNINEIYGIKIFYQDYSQREPQLLKLPACQEFCPLDKFIDIVKEYFPEKDSCGNENCPIISESSKIKLATK